MEKMIVAHSIEIAAPAERVWKVLVEPSLTKQYMFGCEAVSTWQPGASLEWKAWPQGKETVFVAGLVVAIEPARRLVYTTYDPRRGADEHALEVSEQLTPIAGGTRLEVTQGDFARVADGAERFGHANDGWAIVLQKIKALSESL
jgi:uncharacterized protein YndB with AHSA1/START domain